MKWEVPTPKFPLRLLQRGGRLMAILSVLGGVGYFLFAVAYSWYTGGGLEFDSIYVLVLVYTAVGMILSTRLGVKTTAMFVAALFAAAAGVLSLFGRTGRASRYERAAAMLKAAARGTEEEAELLGLRHLPKR
jgi:drug/metabolite transporter (DMT)-like permease